MGLYARNNPVEIAIAVWPWGAYLGEEALEQGVRCKISSYRRYRPEHAAAVRQGVGPVHQLGAREARGDRAAGYDEAILLNEQGYIADGSGENVFVVRDGVIHTPPISDSCLPGITRDSMMRIATELGYEVREVSLVRTDLYFADEVFLCGTAAEVTPVASVDDQAMRRARPGDRDLQRVFFDDRRGP